MRTALIGVLLMLLCTCARAPKTGGRHSPRPNVLFILTDDQGIGDLSLHGNDSISTPHMDALLRESARFDRFYVSPVCAPTRASFLSGMYHPRTGAVFVTRRKETMDAGVVTLAERLRDAGYRTGLYGKWHNGATYPYHPGAQGFDEFLGFTLGHFNDYFVGELKNEPDEAIPFRGDLTQILTDSAATFMTGSQAPFFCMIAYQAPHTPVQVADRYWNAKAELGLSPYNTGIYAMVESIDDRIGSLLGQLEAAGKLDNTIVVFATDNGPNGDRYRQGLRGTKGHIDEGGVRVPFGIRLPGSHPANGKVFTTPAAHIDLLPTVMDLLALPPPTGVDGVSLRPLLEGGELPDRYIYTFRQGDDYDGYPGSMRNERYLYVARDSVRHELYDLLADPGQERDQYGEAGGRGEEMAATYGAFAPGIARPDLVAPPIDLGAGPGIVRLLAHEGEPTGRTHFMDQYGWANDFFVDLGIDGAYWPVTLSGNTRFDVTVAYHLDAEGPVNLILATEAETLLTTKLPVAVTERLPVADRVPRKEVYPRGWAERNLGKVVIPAGTRRLIVRTATQTGTDNAPWIKEVTLQRTGSASGE